MPYAWALRQQKSLKGERADVKWISIFAMPIFIALFVTSGMIKKVGVYDCFVDGAKDGLKSMYGIAAPLIGLMVGISMLRESGTLELISSALSPILLKLKIPSEVLPLAILRPISGSASLAVVTDIFRTYGPDSAAGTIASVMMGSTETTFYTIAVYFGAAGIKNTRHTVTSALTADITAILLSTVVARMIL